MNKIISSILFLAFIAMCIHADAQEGNASPPDQQVMTGAEHIYSVEFHEGNSYQWNIELIDAEGDVSQLTTLSAKNQFTVTWNAAGNYRITVTEKTADNCEASRELVVRCSENNSDLQIFDVVACASGTGVSTTMRLPVTVTNFTPPWRIKYQVDDGAPQEVSVDSDTHEIVQELDELEGGAPTIKNIRIIDMYDKYKRKPATLNGEELTFPVTAKMILNQLPATTQIEYN